MTNVLTLANLKALMITFMVAATLAAVVPSISIQVETNAAHACEFDEPDCD
jgi:hypothetical protein